MISGWKKISSPININDINVTLLFIYWNTACIRYRLPYPQKKNTTSKSTDAIAAWIVKIFNVATEFYQLVSNNHDIDTYYPSVVFDDLSSSKLNNTLIIEHSKCTKIELFIKSLKKFIGPHRKYTLSNKKIKSVYK